MRTRCLATALLLLPAATLAQAPRAHRGTMLTPAITTVDPARIAAALARADSASQAGRNREARRIYQDLIQEQVAADQYAGEAMWRLALNYLYSDDARRAAEQLDVTAAAAARYGDPALQLRATFEAAALWQKLRRPDLVAERIDRTRALLQSPLVPDADKDAVRQRMQ